MPASDPSTPAWKHLALCEDWLETLVAAGFAPDKPSFFLWESVTMYLDREAVESTQRTIATTARGSVVAFDYFSTELIEDRSLFMRYARAVLNAVGEPFGSFGLDTTPPVPSLSIWGETRKTRKLVEKRAGKEPKPC